LSRCPGGVEVRGLLGGYRTGFKVGPLSFSVGEGEILVIAGPNASGKTTLLRLLSGVLRAEDGEVLLCGEEQHRFLSARPPKLSYVPSFPEADLMATPEEIILASSGSVERAVGYIPLIEGFLRRKLLHLSSGQRRLACIARGFSTSPRILLIDEPLVHLDVSMQGLVLRSMKRLAGEGATVIVTMHELHIAPLIADKMLLMKDGRLVRFGSPEEILEKELLENIYGVELMEVEMERKRIYLPKTPARPW